MHTDPENVKKSMFRKKMTPDSGVDCQLQNTDFVASWEPGALVNFQLYISTIYVYDLYMLQSSSMHTRSRRKLCQKDRREIESYSTV